MNISEARLIEHYCRFCEKVFNRSYNRDRHEKQNCPKRFVGEDDDSSYTAEEESIQDEENEDSIGEEPAVEKEENEDGEEEEDVKEID